MTKCGRFRLGRHSAIWIISPPALWGWGPRCARPLSTSHIRTTPAAQPTSSTTYRTLDCDEHCVETEAKKSRFIAWAWPVDSPEAALTRIAARRDPSASHNCFAFRIGQIYRSSDDGEPGGTAGRPILAAIEGEVLDGVCVMVTRHFGGVKLGTGGLVRAYGGAARACLRDAPRRWAIASAIIRAEVPFDSMGAAATAADRAGARRAGEEYGNSGVVLRLEVQADGAEALCQALRDASGGRITAALEVEPPP